MSNQKSTSDLLYPISKSHIKTLQKFDRQSLLIQQDGPVKCMLPTNILEE